MSGAYELRIGSRAYVIKLTPSNMALLINFFRLAATSPSPDQFRAWQAELEKVWAMVSSQFNPKPDPKDEPTLMFALLKLLADKAEEIMSFSIREVPGN